MTLSLPALVRHELRLAVRANPARPVARAIVLGLLLIVPVLGGLGAAWLLRAAPAMPEGAIGTLSAVAALLVVLLLSGASVHVLRTFHDRGDLDLLLAAPVPPRRVLAAKAMAVHVAVAAPLTIILSPFLIASALFGHPGWLGGIAMIGAIAVLATSLAFGLATLLFRALGSRQARRVIQIGGGVIAATVAVMGQAPTFAPTAFGQVRAALAAVPPTPLDWPGRAVLGAPLPLLAMLLLAAGAATVAAPLAAAHLGRGEGASADAVPVDGGTGATAGRRRQRAFRRGGVLAILLTKELRLLWRDPELLASVALQLAYMVPAFGLIFAGGGLSPARVAAACVLFCALLPSSLGWLTICGEDAPDLIVTAPVSPATVIRAKILAACLPALVLAIPIWLLVLKIDWRAAAIALLLAPVAALAAAAQQLWLGAPKPRRAFRSRQQGSMLLAISEYVMAGSWSLTTAFLYRGSPWAAVPLAVAALVLATSWSFRVRR